MKKFNYEVRYYLDELEKLNETYYRKYIQVIQRYLRTKNAVFLDVGFGSGTVLSIFQDQGYKNGYGVDISKLFVREGKKKGLRNLYSYDGVKLPFNDNHFDVIGSFNVLEHTENPKDFLVDQIKKARKGGKIIVACPNFLSVFFPSKHRRLKGFKNKIRNFFSILDKLLFSKNLIFEKMHPVIRKHFEYDDDAIVVTNLLDLKRLFTQNNCKIVYESGFINFDSLPFRVLNGIPVMKYLLPSCFVVAEKLK